MDKNGPDARGSKCARDSGVVCAGKSSSDPRKKRPQDPPKYYNKNYLRRYNQNESTTSLTSSRVASRSPARGIPSSSSRRNTSAAYAPTDQTSSAGKNQQKYA
uniref:Uncharacterized protein n=1 Tax=Trichogramma kaykai TaxID=54128 RepID=A0ABD2XBY8_9HYME